MATKSATILVRRDTAASFTSVDPILLLGEWALETDTNKIKIGDGSTAWTSLGYKIEAVLTSSEKTSIGTAEQAANKNVANGYCPLDANSKVPLANLPDSIVGQLEYKGVWNANINTPTMTAAASGNTGNYYIVSVAGATNIDGITDWQVGDWLVSNGTTWDKIDNTDKVSSVAGRTGAVTLDLDDISETATKKIMTANERTKLAGIEAGADVTDATNVAAAGAIMENDTIDGGNA